MLHGKPSNVCTSTQDSVPGGLPSAESAGLTGPPVNEDGLW